MVLKPQGKDYKTLGLEKNATEEEVAKAYERMKALYSQSSLATYSLLTDNSLSAVIQGTVPQRTTAPVRTARRRRDT